MTRPADIASALLEDDEVDPKAYAMALPRWVVAFQMPGELATL